MTPEQARGARAMLNLDMKSVCELADVGKRTLTEFEAGQRSINDTTMIKIRSFYISKGVKFGDPRINNNMITLVNIQEFDDKIHSPIRSKREYVDCFRTLDLIAALNSAREIIESARPGICFSGVLLNEIMLRMDINQKELSYILKCSPSFVSAIILGKKRITPSIIESLYEFCDKFEFDFRRVLETEKSVYKEFMKIMNLIDTVEEQINSLYQSHAIRR